MLGPEAQIMCSSVDGESPPKLLSDVVYILTLENIGNHTVIESNRAHYHLVLENNIWSTKSMNQHAIHFSYSLGALHFLSLFCKNTAFI